MNFRIFLSALPVVVFLTLLQVAPPWLSVLGALVASSFVFAVTYTNRLIGALSAFSFAIVATTALVGIIWNSEKAYLSYGPIADLLFPFVYLASIYVRRPLVGGIARELAPTFTAAIPPDARVFMRLSWAWAAFDVLHGVVMLELLRNMSAAEYIVWSRIAGWPMTGSLLLLSAVLIWRSARTRASC